MIKKKYEENLYFTVHLKFPSLSSYAQIWPKKNILCYTQVLFFPSSFYNETYVYAFPHSSNNLNNYTIQEKSEFLDFQTSNSSIRHCSRQQRCSFKNLRFEGNLIFSATKLAKDSCIHTIYTHTCVCVFITDALEILIDLRKRAGI